MQPATQRRTAIQAGKGNLLPVMIGRLMVMNDVPGMEDNSYRLKVPFIIPETCSNREYQP
jgi:hypothetical protein